ncbi:MAG: hypothetical protein ACLFR8_09125 [Alkalispirochaeta sp.]
MATKEWCSIAATPVFRWRDLVRIEASAGDRKEHPALNRSRRVGRLAVSRRRLETLVETAVPVDIARYRIRFLPRLQAVLLVPRNPSRLEVGRPIPAVALEGLLRRTGGTRITGRTAIDFPTPRGIDRYVVSPAGLLACAPLPLESPNGRDADGSHTGRVGKPGTRTSSVGWRRTGNAGTGEDLPRPGGTDPLHRYHLRTVPLRYTPPRRIPIAPGEYIAIAFALLGIVIFGSTSLGINDDPPSLPVVGAPAGPAPVPFVETLTSIPRVLPGAVLLEIEREGEHFYLHLVDITESAGKHGSAARALAALPAVRRVHRKGDRFEIEGVAR